MNRLYVLGRKPALAVRYYADQHIEEVFEFLCENVLHAQAKLIELFLVKQLESEMRGRIAFDDRLDRAAHRKNALMELRRHVLPQVRQENEFVRWVLSTELIYDWVLTFLREAISDLYQRSLRSLRFICVHPLLGLLNRVGVDGLSPLAVGLPRGELFGSGPLNKASTKLRMIKDQEDYLNDFGHLPLTWAHREPSFVKKIRNRSALGAPDGGRVGSSP